MISTVLAAVFGWMLINLWITVGMIAVCGATVDSGRDMALIFAATIVTPAVFEIVSRFDDDA